MSIDWNIIPTKTAIDHVHEKIKPYIHHTTLLSSTSINKQIGANIFFKCENFQKVGAFKFRGAINAVLSLSEPERKQGVATHSSGNHAQGLALSAKILGIPAFIVMPQNAPKVKVNAVREYGANITFCESNLASREKVLKEVMEKTGAVMIHPFDDYRIIAGQATVAKEVLEDLSNVDIIMAPVGGGGLISGTCLSAKYYSEKVEVFAGEPDGANDAYLSLRNGKITQIDHPNTIADGLLTTISEKTYEIITEHISAIITVTDTEIIDAMRLLWERLKIVVEPSGAVPFAALLKKQDAFQGKNICIILSGGNVDLSKLPF